MTIQPTLIAGPGSLAAWGNPEGALSVVAIEVAVAAATSIQITIWGVPRTILAEFRRSAQDTLDRAARGILVQIDDAESCMDLIGTLTGTRCQGAPMKL